MFELIGPESVIEIDAVVSPHPGGLLPIDLGNFSSVLRRLCSGLRSFPPKLTTSQTDPGGVLPVAYNEHSAGLGL